MIPAVIMLLVQGGVFLGVPAVLLAYGMLELGRIVGGKPGLKAGAAAGLLLAAAPLLWLLGNAGLMIARTGWPQTLDGEDYQTLALIWFALAPVIAVGGMLFFNWAGQVEKAELRLLRG